MHFSKALALPLTLALSMGAFGCGIVSKDLDGELRFNFEIDSTDNHYADVVSFDPNSNEDVKNNRDKVEAGSVVKISLELTEVTPGNEAYWVAGTVDVKPKTATEYISGVGAWGGIPLYSDDEATTPALGQAFVLDMPIERVKTLSDLVFKQTDPIDVQIQGFSFDKYFEPHAPVRLKGEVVVNVEFTISAP